MADDNALLSHSREIREAAIRRRDEIEARHRARQQDISMPDPLGALKHKLYRVLHEASGLPQLEVQTDLIERYRFKADLALKFPGLLRAGGPRAFAQDHVGWILESLESPEFVGEIAAVHSAGMYINLTLSDAWLLQAAKTVVEAGEGYGASSALAQERYVVDYSSPNIAKTLHAGHIRSTIIGDVLSNVLQEAGGLVFRVNHINDFGGFGFLLEGHRRFEGMFPSDMGLNKRSLEIYRLRRVMERAVAENASLEDLPHDDASQLRRFFPGVESRGQIAEAFQQFTDSADARFAALEAGNPGEVALWKSLVLASLDDFSSFYESLAISIDFVLGESFYAQAGLALVDKWLQMGSAVVYGEAEAAEDVHQLGESLDAGDVSQSEYDSLVEATRKDIGAVVVRLSPAERYVVRRRDGRSIYSTRDLAAVVVRGELFHPTCYIYVVGQEQKSHFARLFATSYQLGLADPARTTFEHLFFGFYVDAHTGKKLSSRESAAGVALLFEVAEAYFRMRESDRMDRTTGDDVARQLTVASLVFNDLKQAIRSSVSLDLDDLSSLIEVFEQSGGAYVIYSACRAGSIVRRVSVLGESVEHLDGQALDSSEVRLLLEVLNYPAIVISAARERDVSILVRYLWHLSNLYNSYYAKFRVLTESGVVTSRLQITAAVERTIRNGLRLCNVDCPEAI
jgi:arginyl-tRNA synthetase